MDKNNYYLSFLPKYNPSAIVIFGENGDVLFQNIKDIGVNNHKDLILNDKTDMSVFQCTDTFYQIDVQGISEENFILTDITEVIELNDAIEETQREVIYSKTLALLYGLSPKEVDKLHMASPMHDIGKVGIPDAILNAPRKLTVDEFKIMKTHALLRYEMLKNQISQFYKQLP
jgi:response regulator RpfG family c-di-GMP phosphodiesterase